MNRNRYPFVILGILCVLLPLAAIAQEPGSPPPSPTVQPFDQRNIPLASSKEINLANARKKIVLQRNKVISKLTELDMKYFAERDPAIKASIAKKRNELRAQLQILENQMVAMLKRLSKMVTARVSVANPSVTSMGNIEDIKVVQRQMTLATNRANELRKAGKKESDPEYAMMSQRFKDYSTQLGSKMTRLTPVELKMLGDGKNISELNKKH